MSLLAAFVAMLGKQWLNRYLRHTGGSMIERCGDRQRKFDGLEKWPFRFCMESLPIMLQIALLLLTCGLSRYVWSVNVSVGRVVISFTALGVLFYIAVVAAGTSSYECPFQTPVSIGLRHLRDSETTRKVLASLFPHRVVSAAHTIWRNTRQALALAIRSTVTKVGHQTIIILLRVDRAFGNAKQRLVQGIQRFRRTGLPPTTAQDSHRPPSRIRSGIRSVATKAGYQTIILLLQIDRAVVNVKQRLIQAFRPAHLLPTTVEDAQDQPPVTQDSPTLLVRVRNLEYLRRRNTDNARCVSWVLRNITDPEAIDSDVRLAGTIRWFDGDSNHDPPFDLIVSAFEECFDATKQLYPGMRDRAYFSARAILQINMRARAQSHKLASKDPIPAVSSSSVQRIQHTDPDLYHIIRMLECNLEDGKPTLDFPKSTNTHTHSLWMLTLFVDLTRVGPNPTLASYGSYLSMATGDHQAVIANTLLMWYMFLGGCVEEETLWAVDKSYVVVLLLFSSSSLLILVYASDSLETIFSHLSTRVMNVIADGNGLRHLNLLLEFLAAWENRPEYLTPMAYQWCSAISEAAGRLGVGEALANPAPNLPEIQSQLQPKCSCQNCDYLRSHPRPRPQDLVNPDFPSGAEYLSSITEEAFSHVGPDCDPVRTGDTSRHTCGCPRNTISLHRVALLPIILDIGFHLAGPGRVSTLYLNHTSHHEWAFEVAFSSNNGEVIVDAVNAWIVESYQTPPGSFASYFTKRAENSRPFSPRLRQAVIRAIGPIWDGDPEVLGLEAVRLLNRLNVGIEDVVEKKIWGRPLAAMICLPTGLESLSPHYWNFLDKLQLDRCLHGTPGSRSVEVMRSLEEGEDWEKLEVWMVVVWCSLPEPTPVPMMEDVERVTLKLLLQRPSAFLRFETQCKQGCIFDSHKTGLQQICDQARAESLPSGFPPPPYVSVRPASRLLVLISPFSLLQSIESRSATRSPPFCRG
jgi:hypothetical protein